MTDHTRFPIGATLTLDALSVNPYPYYRRLLAEEPVTWVPEVKLWYVARRADVIAVLDNMAAFTVQSPHSLLDETFGTMMLSADGELHQRLRNPFAGAFLPKAVRASSVALLEAQAHALIERFIADGTTDLVKTFADPLALYAVTAALGVPIVDFAQLRGWYHDFAAALSNFRHDPAMRARGQRAAHAFGHQLAAHLARLRVAPDESLLSQLLHDPETNLTERELISNLFVIIFGGLETTAAMFVNTIWALLTHPDHYAAVQRDPDLIKAAVEETLRWECPVQTATRHVTQPVTIGGVPFAVGETVQCLLGAANRDPAYFTDPDRFDLHRPNAAHHLAFARGRHHCLGAALARLEGEVGLRTLFARLPALRLSPAHQAAPYGHEFRSVPTLLVAW